MRLQLCFILLHPLSTDWLLTHILIVNCPICPICQLKMSCILNIETSTSVCSVALSMDGEVLFAKASFDGPSHAALLGVFVEEALSVLKKKGKRALDAVAVSSGPGSYTGLRIGVSVAKGLCFGFGIPLIWHSYVGHHGCYCQQ